MEKDYELNKIDNDTYDVITNTIDCANGAEALEKVGIPVEYQEVTLQNDEGQDYEVQASICSLDEEEDYFRIIGIDNFNSEVYSVRIKRI